MSQIILTSDAYTALPKSTGTVQNISPDGATVEITDTQNTLNSGIVLRPGCGFQVSGTQLYARSVWQTGATIRFIEAVSGGSGGGGGGGGTASDTAVEDMLYDVFGN